MEAFKEMVQLVWGEVPGKFGEKVVHILHDGLVLASLKIKTTN